MQSTSIILVAMKKLIHSARDRKQKHWFKADKYNFLHNQSMEQKLADVTKNRLHRGSFFFMKQNIYHGKHATSLDQPRLHLRKQPLRSHELRQYNH